MPSFPVPSSAGGPSAPTLADWQFEYNGLVLGPGTNFGYKQIRGLGALPKIRTGDSALPRDHGELGGLDLMGGRDPGLDLWVTPDESSLLNATLALATALVPIPSAANLLPLWFQVPGFQPLCSMCRPRQKTDNWDALFTAGAKTEPKADWHANDPRIYGAGRTASMTLGPPSGGLPFPVGPFPVGPFSTSTPSQVTVTNNGNVEMRPAVLFTGPITPTIINSSISSLPYVSLANPSGGFAVAAGDQLLLDMGTPHRALYYVGGYTAGSAPGNVMYWVQQGSTWWNLPPGESVISLTGSGGDGAAAEIWLTDAYMF